MSTLDLAVIGGTGLYAIDALKIVERRTLSTPYGDPSSAIAIAEHQGRRVGFLARHGEKHHLAPHRVNYRANIWALHSLGTPAIIAVNAVGGIREDMGPQAWVVPDQLIDYTWGRSSSFCDQDGAEVLHVDFTRPYAEGLRRRLLDAARAVGQPVVDGGCYAATQGPRLETAAEVERLRRDGCDLIGMTGMPEAVLARELGVDYACLAVVANWAAGCGGDQEISLEEIHANLEKAMSAVPETLISVLESGSIHN